MVKGGMTMAEIIKLGSLYFNRRSQKVGVKYNGRQINFGPEIPGKELQWVKVNGLLIADRCICVNVSWEQLNDQGFIFGTPIQINGHFYLCRCLKVGAEKNIPNEWDAALDEAGEDDELWHWKGCFFWGQETPADWAESRVYRGSYLARGWSNYSASVRVGTLGFRPAMEYLGSVSCSPDTLVGKAIKAYFSGGVSIEGCLVDFSDYDIILKPVTPIPADCPRAVKDGCNIVVSRDNIIWLKES